MCKAPNAAEDFNFNSPEEQEAVKEVSMYVRHRADIYMLPSPGGEQRGAEGSRGGGSEVMRVSSMM